MGELDQLNEVLEVIIADEKFIPNIAKLLKKMHEELIKVGFEPSAADRIVANYKATGS